MSNENEKKKINLKEAMQQQLARKKEALANGKQVHNGIGTNKKLQNQQHKKTSNNRRKMGS